MILIRLLKNGKLLFDAPATVGEDIILPRGKRSNQQKCQANSYQFPTLIPFNQALSLLTWRAAGPPANL